MFRGFIVLYIVVMFIGISYAKEGKDPDAVFDETSFDFGEIKEGAVIEHSFTVVNKGTDMLEIRDVKPDCGCTSSEFDKRIPAGGKGRITLKLDTDGYKDKITKNTRVFTNDPDKEMTLLSLEAFVRSPILMSKEYVVFKGAPGDSLTESIDVKAQEKTSLKLDVIEYTLKDKVSFSMEEIEKGNTYRLYFRTKPNQSGAFSGQLRLKTNYPDKAEILIKIRGRLINEDEG